MRDPNVQEVPPGEVRRGVLSPSVGVAVEIPYVVVRGRKPGPTLLATAGVHGAEYASIEAANRIAASDPEHLAGTLIVLPIVNPPSFFARSIYVNPVDGKNLNRVFPGRVDGTYAERLAHWLTTTFIRHADAYVDLHGGDMIESLSPFAIFARDHEPSRALATAFGLPLLIASGGTGMTYAAASSHDVPAVLAEAGGLGQWPEESIEPLTAGVRRVMQHLGMLVGEPEPRDVRGLDTFAWLRSEHRGLWYPTVVGGDEVIAGQEVGVVKDLHGEVVQRAVSPHAGVVLFAVASLAIDDGDPLVGIGA